MVKRDISHQSEIIRKIFHVIAGVLFIGIALVIETMAGMPTLLLAMLIALLLSLVSDHLRIERGVHTHIFRWLQRAREVDHLHATSFTFIGALLAFTFFERDIAYAAMAMFFFGDAAAAIIGRTFGRRKLIGKKSLIGSGSMLLVNVAACYGITRSLPITLVMAAVSTIIEAISEKMDDSFLIILFSGAAAQLLRLLL
ncbi:MAG: hypothetical protein AABY13_04695 [Nanoarchaeota archaeon]